MGSVNLYKIEDNKQQQFLQEISAKMICQNTITIERIYNDVSRNYGFTLYLFRPERDKDISWQWVLDAFNNEDLNIWPNPKAVILIEVDEIQYAVTFGSSFFIVNKFCDKDFGFNFARKFKFKGIKTTTLTSPNSQRNKTVNTYINYNNLEFSSGESFTKIKGYAEIPEGFTTFKSSIEVGNSIRFSIEKDSLDAIIDLIEFVEGTIASDTEYYKIPVFTKVIDSDLIEILDAELKASIAENPAQINISELDIIGATEVFNNNDSDFILKYKNCQKPVQELSNNSLQNFCTEFGLSIRDVLLDIKVVSQKDGIPVRTDIVKNMIDYTNENEKCIISLGQWYRYNTDYLQYLSDSISEISVSYNPDYDFNSEIHNQFVAQKYEEEKNDPKYNGKKCDEILSSLKHKYYAERCFNIIRELEDGFLNFDRQDTATGFEKMDLYDPQSHTMFAVKKGKSSSDLCYAIDQSLTSLKIYKSGSSSGMPDNIECVGLWFILERQEHLNTDEHGCVQLSELNMLMLQNSIDQWKKEVRLTGYKPIVYINYRVID